MSYVVPPLMKYNVVSPQEYMKYHAESVREIEKFWAAQALQLKWTRRWSQTRGGEGFHARWFTEGLIDAYYNVIGRHLSLGLGDRPAVIVEWEDGTAQVATFLDLDRASRRAASVMQELGVRPGDWVAILAPQSLEATVALLGAFRVGAAVETLFTGWGWWELHKRLRRRQPKLVVAFAEMQRRGKKIDLLSPLLRALEKLDERPELFLVGGSHSLGRPFEDLVSGSLHESSLPFPADGPLVGFHAGYEDDFRPITHPAGGYLVQVNAVSRWVGMRPRDTVFCTVSLGWITGVSHCLLGALMVGSTALFYNGSPDQPSWERWLEVLDNYAATLFITTSTALRLLKKNLERVKGYNLDALKAVIVTGEPLEESLWRWLYAEVGTGSSPMIDSVPGRTGRIPVFNTYIQTELGTFVTGNLLNLAFAPILPGAAGLPIWGFDLDVVEEGGRSLRGKRGRLVVKKPWPSLPLEPLPMWGEYYDAGDEAVMNEDGYLTVLGRADGVIKTSGFRLSPGAIEDALESAGRARGAIAFGLPDSTRFELVGVAIEDGEPEEVRRAVRELVGPIAEPSYISRETVEGDKRWGRRLLRERAAAGR